MASEADEEVKLSEEQQQLRRLDEKNISIQMVMQGDSENFPVIFRLKNPSFIQKINNNETLDCWRYRSS